MEAARREKRKWSMRKNREGEECRDRAESAGKAELEREDGEEVVEGAERAVEG